MLKLSTFSVNPDSEVDGVWVNVGQGAEILVARLGNPRYVEMYERLMGPYQSQKEAGTLDNELEEEIICTVIAHTILLNWRGIGDDAGQEVRYSKEKCREVLMDPQYRPFRGVVMGHARNLDHFRKARMEAISKNSGPSSPGA